MLRGESDRFEVGSDARSHFAWLRTRLSLERTLMAWVRTAVSLIAFGFTIFQFFEWMRKSQGLAATEHSAAPRYVGMLLVAAGIVTLAVSAWQYQKMVRYLWSKEFSALAGVAQAPIHTPLFVVTIVLIFAGLLALGSVIFGLP